MTAVAPGPFVWDWGAASELGGRSEQQDRWGVFVSPQTEGVLAVLADGMGGHLDGAVGAQTAVAEAERFIQADAPIANPLAALDQLCRRMHQAIDQRSENARSTVVMVWLQQGQGYWLNVGDSRLYHFRDGQRLMRTRDHSAVQLLMDLGEITESEMGTHPAQNRLYRSLGGGETPQPDSGRVDLQPGDLLALCSDGVWEHASEQEIQAAAQADDLTAAAQRLARQAAQRGGAQADNATLVLLRATVAKASSGPSPVRPSWWQRLLRDLGLGPRAGGDS